MGALDVLERLDRRVVPGLARRPEVVFFMIGLVALAAGATRISLATAEQAPGTRGEDQVVVPEGGVAADDLLRVGPEPGEDVEAYIATRAEELATLADREPAIETTAIVSLDDYVTPDELDALHDGQPWTLRAVRYSLTAGLDGAEMPDSVLVRGRIEVPERRSVQQVVQALRGAADEVRLAARDLDALIDTTEDPEFSAVFERDRDRLLDAAAHVDGEGCRCLYALEVAGRLDALARLAGAPQVRLVDAAPPGPVGRRLGLVGLLPDESGPYETGP